MALAATYIRPDRVMRTSVIDPYPIRQRSPVAIARRTINPFSRGIRPTGSVLSGSGDTLATKARAMRKVRQYVARTGRRPVGVAPMPVRIGTSHAGQVMRATASLYPKHEYAALKAAYIAHLAKSTGNIWDITNAEQRQLRMLRRPGWGQYKPLPVPAWWGPMRALRSR